MDLFNRIIDAVLKLREHSQRKRFAQPRYLRFRVEQLEPRILLSADLIPQADPATSSSPKWLCDGFHDVWQGVSIFRVSFSKKGY